MSDKQTYFSKVGAYLDNDLIGEDLASFENELKSNPKLANELNYQKDLIEGIKNFRKAELIGHFDSLPISTGVSTGIIAKFIAGAAVVGGISFGIYNMITVQTPEQENTIAADQKEISQASEEVIIPQSEKSESIYKDNEALEENIPEPKAQPETVNKQTIETTSEQVVPVVPNPIQDMDTAESEEDLEIPENIIGSIENVEKNTPEVEIISNIRRYQFHYAVKDGKLELYGDFDEEPYQILEINVNDEKQLFLYFKEKYYSIDSQMDNITPLIEITNESIIIKLDEIKNSDS
jgi:hypothetical protein